MRHFLVTGIGHSGTGWAYKAMNYMGHATGHEWVYNFGLREPIWAGLKGESSWPAAALLRALPDDWPILHLTRDPIRVVSSLHLSGFTQKKNEDTPYMKNVRKVLPGIDQITNDPLRAVFLYHQWNRMIESARQPRMMVKIEDLSTEAAVLCDAVRYLTGTIPSPHLAQEAIRAIPKNYNTHARGKVGLRWGDLPDGRLTEQLIFMALEYGYEVTK